jgi:polyphosphate glucokinase
MMSLAVGIDVGGSGIKGAVVDVSTGEFVSEREKILTPAALDPDGLVKVLDELIERLDGRSLPLGIGFPGVIRSGVIGTAANLDKRLVGLDLEKRMGERVKGPVAVMNDADAAGVAEMRLGEGQTFSDSGVVMVLTVGTGIGTALFNSGQLVPNCEMGHVQFNGKDAELLVSERARKKQDLSWKRWGRRFNRYLEYLAFLLQVDIFILGGGGLKKADRFEEFLTLDVPWSFARFGNRAGIVGAALHASER